MCNVSVQDQQLVQCRPTLQVKTIGTIVYSSEQRFMTCAYTEREREPLCLNSAQLMKGELCGDVLTLGYGPNPGPRVRRVHRKFPERDLIFATTNLQPRALIQVGETLVGLLV